jgi:hypothetical protein
LIRWLGRLFRDREMDGWNAVGAAMDRTEAYIAERCELCRGVRYNCPQCGVRIETHSHEGDFLCEAHGFVRPVRCPDGELRPQQEVK